MISLLVEKLNRIGIGRRYRRDAERKTPFLGGALGGVREGCAPDRPPISEG
jgi:hypothetical protein